MKLNKNKATLDVEVLRMIVDHVRTFEPIVKVLQRSEVEGTLAKELQAPWRKLKKLLIASELPGSEDDSKSAGKELDGRYCCKLSTREGGVMNCRDYNAWYAFAWAGCVGEALLAGYDASLTSGRCRRRKGCPQYR